VVPHGIVDAEPDEPAQVRLTKRFRALSRKGKKSTVVATAIARELAAFIWAIAREVTGTRSPRAV
jgi:hypothetical protein